MCNKHKNFYLNCYECFKIYFNFYRSKVFSSVSTAFNVSSLILSASQIENDITVIKGNKFSASFYLVDAISNTAVSNPSYQVMLSYLK